MFIQLATYMYSIYLYELILMYELVVTFDTRDDTLLVEREACDSLCTLSTLNLYS